jgi:hypothetical protein
LHRARRLDHASMIFDQLKQLYLDPS